MTDCDQSTVYLWDGDTGQLVPRARTAGLEAARRLPRPDRPRRPGPRGSLGPEALDRSPSERRAHPEPGTDEPLTIRTDAAVIERA